MTRCSRCDWNYRAEMLQPVIGAILRQPVCAICALAMINAIHGTRMPAFHGEQAETMRQDAIHWRASHPKAAPRPELGDDEHGR